MLSGSPLPKCKCGVVVSLYFSERLNTHVCPVCLDKEVIDLTKKLEKLLEATVGIRDISSADGSAERSKRMVALMGAINAADGRGSLR